MPYKNILFLSAGTALLFSAALCSESTAASLPYKQGVIIVEFNKNLQKPFDQVLASGQPMSQALVNNDGQDLSHLINKYKISQAQMLFDGIGDSLVPAIKVDTSKSAKALSQQEDLIYQQLQSKYPKRSLRIPPGYQRPNFLHIYAVQVDPNANMDQVVSDFQNDPNVESVGLDYIVNNTTKLSNNSPTTNIRTSNVTHVNKNLVNDPLFPLQWGLKVINAPQAWNYSEGEGIVVAVIDSDGVYYTHPDLVNQMWHDPITGDMGWNTVDNNNQVMYTGFHGTTVAGIIAAQQNNNIGISGVSPKAKLMVIKDGYDLASTIKGYMWAAAHGADVTSDDHLFWPSSYKSLEDAIKFAYSLGVVVVIASGDSPAFGDFSSPQNMDEVILVGEVDENLSMDGTSEFSTGGTRLSLVAPGIHILTTKTPVDGAQSPPGSAGEGYGYYDGTSEATPHVSGVVALMLSMHPDWTNEKIKEVLKYTAVDNIEQGDLTTGAGFLNADTALLNSQDPPTAQITNFSIIRQITPGENTIPIMGEADGSNFSNYQLFYHDGPNDQTSWTAITAPIFKPVHNGVLGAWNVSNLAVDNYIVRLVVTDKFGKSMEDKRWAYKEQYPLTQLTNSGRERQRLVYSDGRIAWYDTLNGYTVYTFNLAAKTQKQVTPQSGNVYYFSFDGSNVIWVDGNRNSDVFLTNINTSKEVRLTTNGNNAYVAISGNNIVWENQNNNLFYCTYDPVQGLCNPQTFALNGYNPVISGNNIVYTDFGLGSIAVYNIAQKQASKLNAGSGNYAINGNLIAWNETPNTFGYCIYVPSTQTCAQKQFSSPAGYSFYQSINVSGNKIVWIATKDTAQYAFVYDITTQITTRLTTYPSEKDSITTDGKSVYLDDLRNGSNNIFMTTAS